MILGLRDFPARPGRLRRRAASRYRNPARPPTYGTLTGTRRSIPASGSTGSARAGGSGSPCSMQPQVADAVRKRVEAFQTAGISGVDLFLAAFGPALEEFSRHWPLRRGEPRDRPQERRGQRTLLEEPWDPYAVSPEDALDVARREVKRWRLERLTHLKANADLDPATAFFVLAWDTQRKPPGGSRAGRPARRTGGGGETGAVLSGRKGRSDRTVQRQGTRRVPCPASVRYNTPICIPWTGREDRRLLCASRPRSRTRAASASPSWSTRAEARPPHRRLHRSDRLRTGFREAPPGGRLTNALQPGDRLVVSELSRTSRPRS